MKPTCIILNTNYRNNHPMSARNRRRRYPRRYQLPGDRSEASKDRVTALVCLAILVFHALFYVAWLAFNYFSK